MEKNKTKNGKKKKKERRKKKVRQDTIPAPSVRRDYT